MNKTSPEQLARLRQNIGDLFDENELRDLCFDLGVKYDDLPAQGTRGKARELVALCERKGQIPKLVKRCRELRPNVEWESEDTGPISPPPQPDSGSAAPVSNPPQPASGKPPVPHPRPGCKIETTVTIISAVLAFAGAVIAVYLGYMGIKWQVEAPIRATQIAEVRLTSVALSATPTPSATRTATPTWTPTSTPTPMSTLTPVPTASPAPTPTATPTPTPRLIAWITYPSTDSQVAQYITVMGEYPADLVDDLWIFVQDPDTGRYHIQAMSLQQGRDNCVVEGVIKRDGKWEIPILLGDSNAVGKSYNIILATANLTVSQSISGQQRAFCLANSFPGLPDLPVGITILKRTRVVRGPDLGGPLPNLQSAGMSTGIVSVTNVTDRSRVPQTITITGTYDGIAGDIWVLVYVYNGRWYPQSIAPCIGDHIRMENGQWWSRVGFGGAQDRGRPFDIVVILANAEANEFLNEVLLAGCRNDYFPGLRTLQLPKGIEVKSHYRVYHQ